MQELLCGQTRIVNRTKPVTQGHNMTEQMQLHEFWILLQLQDLVGEVDLRMHLSIHSPWCSAAWALHACCGR